MMSIGSYHVAAGGKAATELKEQLGLALMAARLGKLRIVIALDGGREDREDMRAYWRGIARNWNIRCEHSASHVELG